MNVTPQPPGLKRTEFVGRALHIVLGNTMNAVRDGRREIQRHFELRLYNPRVINRMEVIFEELVSNTIRHGFTPGSDQSISVVASDTAGMITLVVEDDGEAFDPFAAPEAKPFVALEDATVGGLGISLVRKMASDLRYEKLEPDDITPGSFAPRNRVTVSIRT